jgi:hypothetical protein
MANEQSGTNYYVRMRGKVLGPFSTKQLNTLRSRGQFSEANEISADGTTWESAATLVELFGTGEKRTRSKSSERIEDSSPSIKQPESATPIAADGWYYGIGDKQTGPVTFAELQHKLQFGELSANDLVWKQGMAEWTPASEVAELSELMELPRKKRKSSRKEIDVDGDESEEAPDDPLPSHFLDHVLAGLRSAIDESLVATIGRWAIEIGRYAVYVAILMNLAFWIYLASQYHYYYVGLIGVGIAIVALVLQFSAVKSCGAIGQVVQAASLRMTSMAFLDSMVIILLFGGVIALVYCSAIGFLPRLRSMILVGIAVFILCEQLALMLLHPNSLGISISKRASTGEEGVSILTFFMMLPLRFVSTVFALGTAASIIGTGIAFRQLMDAKPASTELEQALVLAGSSSSTLLASAAFPLAMYVYFVFAYLIIDVIRSILVMPGRMDELISKTGGRQAPSGESG